MGWHPIPIGPNPKKLCWRCANWMHDWRHSEIGCLEVIGKEPRDFVCACVVPGSSGASRKAYAHRTPLS